MVGPASPDMFKELGDESMLTTLKGLGYPGPARLVMREMLPTPFDLEVQQINQFLVAHWQFGYPNYVNVAEFCCAAPRENDNGTNSVKYKLSFDGEHMTLYIGYRAYDSMFESAVGNMCNNVLDWQEIGYLLMDLEEHTAFQLKRWQYRKLLDVCFDAGQCQLCCQKSETLICHECRYAYTNPTECQLCHMAQGKTVGTKYFFYDHEVTCECQVHAMCWLKTFHQQDIELERDTCEMCQKVVDPESESDGDEEYYDAIEDVEEPSPKRRRLE